MFFIGICSILVCCFYTGCSSAPEVQTEAASLAITELNNMEAGEYNVEAVKEAYAAWNTAQKLLADKKYGESKPYLIKAKTQADLGLRQVKTARELRKRETESWVATVDNRLQSLKTDYQNRSAIFKPEQKQQLEEQIKKVEQAFVEFKKEVEAQHYYKTADMGKKTMAMVNEGENIMKDVTKTGKK